MTLTNGVAVWSAITLSLTLGISTTSAQEGHSTKVVPSVNQKTPSVKFAEPAPENPPKIEKKEDIVVLSGVATTARIADPEERVVFSGRVMRMADFVAAVSSSNEAVRRLHNQEKHNREKDQPVRPLQPSD
ncbi:MAG TPA: hypothetical protein VG028_20005 [Terriglobia bacterium]|nr:hypothetical protein [Terriglobia bacterium]